MRKFFCSIVLLVIWPFSCLAGMEKVSIPALDGKLQIPGYWFKAESAGAAALSPVVIDLHGCGGALDAEGALNPVWKRDARYFNLEKIHVLVLDNFTPRGRKSICETATAQRTIHEEDRRADVFAAMRWLSQQPGVDAERIVVMGRSHGAQTVLSVLDRTDSFVKAQPIQPRAAIALYPGCMKFEQQWNYALSAPLLLMIGELDDWTPATRCVNLHRKVVRAQKDAVFDLTVFPGSYHGFDGTAAVRQRSNLGNTRSGSAMVGGNPQAREKAHQLTFEFIARHLNLPLQRTHAERFREHFFVAPATSQFAAINDVAAVPVSEAGQARYQHYLTLPSPKAFVVTEKGRWYFNAEDPEAMMNALEPCDQSKTRCWLYAVDHQVVWQSDVAARTDKTRLRERWPTRWPSADVR